MTLSSDIYNIHEIVKKSTDEKPFIHFTWETKTVVIFVGIKRYFLATINLLIVNTNLIKFY